jgi:hypothetical protein
MKSMTKAQWKQFVDQWKTTGPVLEKIRRDELRKLTYDYDTADALLEIGDRFGRSRKTSGLVEMQRWFMKMAAQQGLGPRSVGEKKSRYRARKTPSLPHRGDDRGRGVRGGDP